MDYLEQAKTFFENAKEGHDLGTIGGIQKMSRFASLANIAIAFAQAEQLKRIADALNSIDTVLANAPGSNGALQVHSYTFDGERY